MVRIRAVLQSSLRALCYSCFEISDLACVTNHLLSGQSRPCPPLVKAHLYAFPHDVTKSSAQDIDALLLASILLIWPPASPAVPTALSNLLLQVHLQRHLHLRTIPTWPLSASSPYSQILHPTHFQIFSLFASSPQMPPGKIFPLDPVWYPMGIGSSCQIFSALNLTLSLPFATTAPGRCPSLDDSHTSSGSVCGMRDCCRRI